MSTITTIQSTDLITNSRADINNNFTNLNSDKIETSVIDTDTALAANSDSKIATQKATKAYADALLALFTSSKSGVSAGPASSSTQTITHTLGRAPIVIRLNSLGAWTSDSGSAMTAGGSHGTYNATGNRCVYLAAGGTTAGSATSTTYAIRCTQADTGSAAETGFATGIVGNITSTTFDIVWTVSGTVTSSNFIWEAN